MNICEMIGKAKEKCTDGDSTLDTTRFRVIVVMMFLSESSKNQDIEELVSTYNKEICNVLGSGHSLTSCLQFCEGKTARPYMDHIMNAVEAKAGELGLS